MFAAWGRAVARARWWVIAAGVVLAIAGGVWGTGVFSAVAAGGFEDPHSESSRAASRIVTELGRQDVDVLVLYSSPDRTVDDPTFKAAVTGTLARVQAEVHSYYDTGSPAFVSSDRHATYAAIRLSTAGSTDQLDAIRDQLAAPGLRTQIGGPTAIFSDVSGRVAGDIGRAEAYSMPILLILLIIVFGSVVAASTPLLVGGLAILGACVATRLLTYVTDVSVFALNIITLMGLGMAIDYALLVVSRYREELAAGHEPTVAIERTLATAGRTVAVSGLTVALALASLLLFPQVFLRSMGFGGMAAVAVAMIASLTLLPAGLALLGPRINALRLPLPFRRRPGGQGSDRGAWARLARSVMRRPWLYLVSVLIILAVLAAPVTRITFGGADSRVLPTSASSRIVDSRISTEFPVTSTYPVQVLATGVDQAGTAALVARLQTRPHVTGASVAAAKGDAVMISVAYAGPATGEDARQVVRDIRGLIPAPGTTIGVTGYTADLLDNLAGLGAKLPWMALFVVVVTFVLLFLAFGSVVLPAKAILMNIVSLGAAFGAVE